MKQECQSLDLHPPVPQKAGNRGLAHRLLASEDGCAPRSCLDKASTAGSSYSHCPAAAAAATYRRVGETPYQQAECWISRGKCNCQR
jgi:hypothetical protein